MTPATHQSPSKPSPRSTSSPNIAIVGVTGAVGQEFLAVLAQRNFPIGQLSLLASPKSAGKEVSFKNKTYKIEQLTADSFRGVDIALFSAGGSVSKQYAPIARDAGAIVVDNSSAFRMTPEVPLVVPEVNPEALAGIKLARTSAGGGGAIIANPNCSTIIALVAVTPLHRAATVTRMIVSTYQAVSGAGQAAMLELRDQTADVLAGKTAQPKVLPYVTAFNLFSHNSEMQPNGYNLEEMKLVHETHKMWNDDKTKISATCVRVPVMRAHAESINLTFAKPLGEDAARDILSKSPGVTVLDDRKANRFPMPLDASHKDDIFVGRIRRDLTADGDHGLNIFVCGDQLRKGAALNAIQIAELLL